MKNLVRNFKAFFNYNEVVPDVLGEKGEFEIEIETIRYITAKDKEGYWYIDFTCYSRFSNFQHYRITEKDPKAIELETFMEFYAANDEKAAQAYLEHNRKVAKMLIKKGLMDKDILE